LNHQLILDFTYPKNVRWQCLRCARCCGDVQNRKRRIVLLPSEVTEICEHVGLRKGDFTNPLAGHEPYAATMKKTGGKCVFLKNGSCSIYDVRPLVCRFFPIWLVKESSKYTFNITEECPGIGQGTRLERDHFISLLRTALNRHTQAK
jgi:Fe-S-cluster containining protein